MFFWLSLLLATVIVSTVIFFVFLNKKRNNKIDKYLKEIIKILQPHYRQRLVIMERKDDRSRSFSASYRGVYVQVGEGVYNFLAGLKLERVNGELVKMTPCSSLEDEHRREIDYIFQKLQAL